jgi:hypothetical protein
MADVHLDAAQMDCVGSYADNSWNHVLVGFLDDQDELDRLNQHRNESHEMPWFNALIEAAITLRNGA